MENGIDRFKEEIAIEHLARVDKWRWGKRLKEVRGEYIYTDFRVWLHCQNIIEYANNEKVFAEWLKQENRTLTEYQRRWIAENHFGWQFTWNEEKKEWESRKV